MTERKDLFRDGNKISDEYDLLDMAIPHHKEFQAQIGLNLLNQFKTEDSSLILELGSGTGETTTEIIKALPNSVVKAVELEQSMILKAKEKQLKGNVEFIESDGLRFLSEQEGNKYDAVVSAYTLHNLDKLTRKSWIEEIFRVLKSNGIFINADKYAYDDFEKYQVVLRDQIKKFKVFEEMGKSDLYQEWVEHYKNDDKENIRLVEGDFIKVLENAGFRGARTVYRRKLEAIMVAHKL
jgi:tRNA (cmo5U34)-methyltransferase